MSGWGEPEGTSGTRPSFPAPQLKDMGTAVAFVAFASTDWIAKTFRCTDEQARQFKADAYHDFECLMSAARQVHRKAP